MLPCRWFLAVVFAASLVTIRPGPADARPLSGLDVSGRVAASWGWLEELTWSYPEFDLVLGWRPGTTSRGFVELALGYTPLDNHTYLADGRTFRASLAAGARFSPTSQWRASAEVALEASFFHADPDLLAEHPDVDLVVGRRALVPSAGLRVAREVTDSLAVGLFARVSMQRLTLFREGDIDPANAGPETDARLLLAGLAVEWRIY